MRSTFGTLLIYILLVILQILLKNIERDFVCTGKQCTWFCHFGCSEIKNRNSFINYNILPLSCDQAFFHFFENWRKYTCFNFWQIFWQCYCILETKNVINKIVSQTKTTGFLYIYFKLQANASIVVWRNHVHLKNMVSRKTHLNFRVFFVIDGALISMWFLPCFVFFCMYILASISTLFAVQRLNQLPEHRYASISSAITRKIIRISTWGLFVY